MGCPDCERSGRRSAFTVLSETGTVAAEGWDAEGRHRLLVGPPTTTYRCQHGHIWTEEGRRQMRQKGGIDPTGVVIARAPVVSNEHLLRALSTPIVTNPRPRVDIRKTLSQLAVQLREAIRELLRSISGRRPPRP